MPQSYCAWIECYLENYDGISYNRVMSLDIPEPVRATKPNLRRMEIHAIPVKRDRRGGRLQEDPRADLYIPTTIVPVNFGREEVEEGETSRVYYHRFVIDALGTIKVWGQERGDGTYSWTIGTLGEIIQRVRSRSEVTSWGADVLKTWNELKSIGIELHTYEVENLLKHYTLTIRQP